MVFFNYPFGETIDQAVDPVLELLSLGLKRIDILLHFTALSAANLVLLFQSRRIV